MRFADLHRIDEPLLGQHKDGFRIALSKRSGLFQSPQEVIIDAASGDSAVDNERVLRQHRLDAFDQLVVHESAKTIKLVAVERDTGSHGVTAALLNQPEFNASPHRATNINAT